MLIQIQFYILGSPKERYPALDLKNPFFVSGKKKQKGFTISENLSGIVYKPKPYVSIVALILKISALCKESFSI